MKLFWASIDSSVAIILGTLKENAALLKLDQPRVSRIV